MAARPVFGIDRDPGVIVGRTGAKPFPKVNPMLAAYGPGPEGTTCRTCVHLVKANVGTAHGGFLKCELRGITSGAGTDHRAKWQACSKYVQ